MQLESSLSTPIQSLYMMSSLPILKLRRRSNSPLRSYWMRFMSQHFDVFPALILATLSDLVILYLIWMIPILNPWLVASTAWFCVIILCCKESHDERFTRMHNSAGAKRVRRSMLTRIMFVELLGRTIGHTCSWQNQVRGDIESPVVFYSCDIFPIWMPKLTMLWWLAHSLV